MYYLLKFDSGNMYIATKSVKSFTAVEVIHNKGYARDVGTVWNLKANECIVRKSDNIEDLRILAALEAL